MAKREKVRETGDDAGSIGAFVIGILILVGVTTCVYVETDGFANETCYHVYDDTDYSPSDDFDVSECHPVDGNLNYYNCCSFKFALDENGEYFKNKTECKGVKKEYRTIEWEVYWHEACR